MLDAVPPIAAAGEGAANDRRRHKTGREGCLLLGRLAILRLGLGDILNLFFHRGEQGEQGEVRRPRDRRFLRRRRSGGLFARRRFTLWIYL
nr:hypothetical protein [Flintibacter muris]